MYTIQIPLPNCPTFVAGLIASQNNKKSDYILTQNVWFIHLLQEAGLNLISLGLGGAASERAAQNSLIESADNYLEYTNVYLRVWMRVPLLGTPPVPIVSVQDPKHARKTAANQMLLGAQVLSFGQYHVDTQQLLDFIGVKGCPLVLKDVLNTDFQDHLWAYKTFWSRTFESLTTIDDNLGLSIYLFVLGELCDSWLSRSLSYTEQITLVWTAGVFFATLA